MSTKPTIADLSEQISQLQRQISQLTSLVSAYNGVTAVDELQINQVAKDFTKRGPEAIHEWNQQRRSSSARKRTK